jgi:hypothetical protein
MTELNSNELTSVNGGTVVPPEFWGPILDAVRGMQVSSDLNDWEAFFQYKSLYASLLEGF